MTTSAEYHRLADEVWSEVESDLLREIGRWRAQQPSRDGFTLVSVIRPVLAALRARLIGEQK